MLILPRYTLRHMNIWERHHDRWPIWLLYSATLLIFPSSRPSTAITATLQAQHTSFMALASKTAALDAELQKLKSIYIQLWRAKTGSARDPFNRQDRGDEAEFGMDGLNVK